MSDFSLAARWAYSIQSALRPDYRPRLQSVGRELGQDLGAVTGSRRLSSAVPIRLSFFLSLLPCFLPLLPFSCLSQFFTENFKPGSSRTDDHQLPRPLASPVLWGALHSRPRRASLFGYCAVVRTPLHSPTTCEAARPPSRYRNDRSFLGILASALGELQSPAPQVTDFRSNLGRSAQLSSQPGCGMFCGVASRAQELRPICEGPKPHGGRTRSGGVGPRHSIDEPDEQRRAIFGGAWGEKGAGQGEHRSTQHQPDTVRGWSVPRVERCASSSISRRSKTLGLLLY
jgi:hypothetical protein